MKLSEVPISPLWNEKKRDENEELEEGLKYNE